MDSLTNQEMPVRLWVPIHANAITGLHNTLWPEQLKLSQLHRLPTLA